MAEDFQTNQNISETPTIVSNTNANTARKRKRSVGDTLTTAYSSVSFAPWKLTGKCRPDSPHFFFSSSYSVIQSGSKSDKEGEDVGDSNNDVDVDIHQVVHQHVNGLCMVTAGELSIPPSKILRSIRFVAKEVPSCSNAEKRKRQAKMMKGRGKVDHVVSPSTVIAELVLENRISAHSHSESEKMDTEKTKKNIIPLRACVWGTILELNNTALTPDVLLEDPLLDGFIAIILPTGRFPPRNTVAKVIGTNTPKDPTFPS